MNIQGFYENCSDIEDYIHPEGRKHLNDVKEEFKDWYKNEEDAEGNWYNAQKSC